MIKKYWPYITGALALIVSLHQIHSYVYETGFKAGQEALIKIHNQEIEKQRKEYEKAVQEALNIISKDYDEEIERLKNEAIVEYRTKEVIKYVDREIVIPSECTDLANDVVRMLNQATSIVINTTGTTQSTDTRESTGVLR